MPTIERIWLLEKYDELVEETHKGSKISQ